MAAEPTHPPDVVGVSWASYLLKMPLRGPCQIIPKRGEEIWALQTEETTTDTNPDQQKAVAESDLVNQFDSLSIKNNESNSNLSNSTSTTSTNSHESATQTPIRKNSNGKSTKSPTPKKSPAAATSTSASGSKKQKGGATTNESGTDPIDTTELALTSSLALPAGYTSLTTCLDSLFDRVVADTVPGWEIDADVSAKDRVLMHQLAEEKQLEHESLGFRPRRHLYVTKPYGKDTQLYLICRMGHIYLEGAPIDALGSELTPLVDSTYRSCRTNRDGTHYHITLIHSSQVETVRNTNPPCLNFTANSTHEVQSNTSAPNSSTVATSSSSLSSSPTTSTISSSGVIRSTREIEEALIYFFGTRLNTPLFEFGLGRASEGSSTAYYRVIQWDQLNELRHELGLPSVDLHITVGFKPQDVHHVRKNVYTLCEAHG